MAPPFNPHTLPDDADGLARNVVTGCMDKAHYLLIGGGLASVNAAKSIRAHDADRALTIVGSENHPPYDRPPLSKKALIDDDFKPDDCYSKFDNFYPDNSIELI